jgi:hypothetical protein
VEHYQPLTSDLLDMACEAVPRADGAIVGLLRTQGRL